jgi:hypothetical protein
MNQPTKQSPLQSNEQLKIETSEVMDTTDKLITITKYVFWDLGEWFFFLAEKFQPQISLLQFPCLLEKNCQIFKKLIWGLCAQVNFATFQHTFFFFQF